MRKLLFILFALVAGVASAQVVPGIDPTIEIQIATFEKNGLAKLDSPAVKKAWLGPGLSFDADTLKISASGYTDEQAQDAVFNAISAGTGVSVNYNDGSNTFTITNTAPSKWTDAGAYTYLTATGDNAVVGASTQLDSDYKLQVDGAGYFDGKLYINGPLNSAGFEGTNIQFFKSSGSFAPPQWMTPESLEPANAEMEVINGTNVLVGPLPTFIKLAQQGATTGQVLKWNGTRWAPDDDDTGSGGGGGIYGGDGSLPSGGTDVTTNGYPLNFITNTAAGDVTNNFQITVPYSNDDAFTNYLAGYTPVDSFKLYNYDGSTYLSTYSGDWNIESNQVIRLAADSVQVSTVATSTKIPAILGLNAQGTLKQITATTDDHVLKWSSGCWVTGAAPGGGGGISGSGTAKQIPYFSASTTLASTADLQLTADNDLQLANALELKVDAAPPSAPADGLSLYTEERALQFPAWVDESGRTWEVAPSEVGSKWAKWSAMGNNTTISNWAITTNGSGTATSRTFATTSAFTATRRIGYVTGTTANTPAGNRHSLAQFFRGNANNKGGFYFAARYGFSTADAANKASFVGMTSTTGALGGSTTPSNLTNIIGFGHDAGQTTLRFLYNDGSGTASSVDLGANFPSNTTDTDMYDVRIYAPSNSSNVYYWIKNIVSGNVASGVVSTNLPSQTQLLATQLWVSNGASAVSVGIDIVQYEVITNY